MAKGNIQTTTSGSALGFEATLWSVAEKLKGNMDAGEFWMGSIDQCGIVEAGGAPTNAPFPIPTGLHHLAQGCPVGGTTLGIVAHCSPQPQRGCSTSDSPAAPLPGEQRTGTRTKHRDSNSGVKFPS